MTESPFVPGARVAIDSGFGGWREDFVEKVHKSGNFTLKGGGAQQWRPSSPYGNGYWQAYKTGRDAWDRTSLRIWDEAADAELREKFAAQARQERRRRLSDLFARLPQDKLTDTMLDQIEAALPDAKPKDEQP